MDSRIEEREAFEVFGIERVFHNDETNLCPAFWDECIQNGEYSRLYIAAGAKADADGKHCINAVCGYGDSSDEKWRYMICALKKPNSDTTGFCTVQIPKTTWAVFRSEKTKTVGNEIPKLFNCAYSEWLPTSGYDKEIGPDMEVYYTDSDGKNWEEVWIPVKK